MAENVNALILPIGADPSQFEKSINEVKSALRSLEKEIANKPFNLITPEDRANLEAYKNTLKSLESNLYNSSKGFDKATESSKKARTALTNLSLVAQDLPFGFIAIQNNIPNLITSFQSLQTEAKNTKTSVASLIGQQFAGASGAVLGLGLGISALTSIITALVQKYGSLGAAIDAVIAKSITLEDINKKIENSYIDVTKNTAGEESNLKSLISIYTDATTSQTALLGVKEKLNKISPTIIAFLTDENRLTQESTRIIEERSNALLKQAVLEGRKQGLIKLISEETAKGEKAVLNVNKLLKNELGLIETLGLAVRSLFVPFKAGPEGIFELLSTEINNANSSISVYEQKLSGVNKLLAQIDGEIAKVTKAIQEESKKQTEAANKLKKEAEERLSKLNQYKQALLKFNQLKINDFEFPDDSKAIDDKIKKLIQYGNVLLDTTKYDFERADALSKVIAVDKEYFANLDITKNKLESVKSSIQSYIGYLYNVREIQKVLSKDISISNLTNELNKAIFLDTSKLRSDIPAIVDLLFPDDKFNKIAEAWEKINKDSAPKLEEFKNKIRDALISKELSTGVKTTYEDVEKQITDAITKLQQLLASDAGIAQRFQDAINKGTNQFKIIQEQIEKFETLKNTIESNLTKPFRDFFDELLDNGKVSFDSFVQLAKDAFKRILAQAIASGIANLISAALSGGGSLAFTKLGAAKKISATLSGLGKVGGLFGSANFSGVQGSSMQMAGAVNLTLRGSDLVASINRTNTTINRVG